MCLSVSTSFAATVEGTVFGRKSRPLPMATVYLKHSTYGVSTNAEGKFFMELNAGTYTLVFSYLGYENLEKKITVSANQRLKFDVRLTLADKQLDEIEIIADKTDRAKTIMKQARKKRIEYLNNIKNYTADCYVKTSVEKESFINDVLKKRKKEESISDYYQKENLNLIEYLAKNYYKAPDKYKEKILAYHNYSDNNEPQNSRSMTIEADIGHHDIAPQNFMPDNPYIFYNGNAQGDFNFYRTYPAGFSSLCKQPLKSPTGTNSALNYRFVFEESFFENGHKINKIKVIPRSKLDALFYGHIYIQDSTWALISVNLSVNEAALLRYKDFNIIAHYRQTEKGIYLPDKIDINYTIKKGNHNILGNTKLACQNYKVNSTLEPKLFNREIKTFEPDAFNRDSAYWAKNRPVALKEKELQFISKTDSVSTYYASDKYLDKQDSLFNIIDFWTPFIGIGYKNHYTGIEMHLGGLLEQIAPFGVGGYRHRLPFYIKKELPGGMLAETRQNIDYGFMNNDLKGKVGFGLTYFPKKFIRTFIEVGNSYVLINKYESIEKTFSRSNYVNEKSAGIVQSAEIINGLYAELKFLYARQVPITGIKLSEWSKRLFGDLNQPVDFEPYTKTELNLELKYRIGQKYIIKKNKKYIIGDNYPEITFKYRKGIPELFGSELNFDYIEFGAAAELNLARFGLSRGQIAIGNFINKKSLRPLEYHYFRSSDRFFFSDPLMSFQLLSESLTTSGTFIQTGYIHHFNGIILNKIPLNRIFKFSLAGGGGTLNIPEQNFYHVEIFSGLERNFHIKKQLLRFGIYGVTSDNTFSNLDVSLKFGFSFWEPFSKKWDY